MKRCIWCLSSATTTFFNKRAHTIPQSLGGKNICENVCDSCNSYFGTPQNGNPAVEVVLKEALNISKHILLHQVRNGPIKINSKHFTSTYFNVNFSRGTITMKPRYSFEPNFQKRLGRLFRRGIYKLYLEERERQLHDAMDSRFDFIREFARYDLSEAHLYVKKPKFQAVLFSLKDIENPEIRFTEYTNQIELKYNLYTYQLMGHYFVIPISLDYKKTFISFIDNMVKENDPFGDGVIPVTHFESIDYLFTHLRE